VSRIEKRIFLALTIVIALTRLLAISHGLFEWDEALFSLGVRDYDVVQHHPHPPGYPLFIGAAKVVHALGVTNEFRAVQVIVTLCAMLLFPALFFLARELGFDFATSICGAALFAFFPNVWMFGGTAFSDVPGATLSIAACALLLRGRRSSRDYILGAIVLGIACGIRPMSLVVAAIPAIVATWSRIRARAFGAIALAGVAGALIIIASYGSAALASESVPAYFAKVREQSQYVHDVDSWHNPHRTPLRHAAKTFFLWPFALRQTMMTIAALAGIGVLASIIHRRYAALFALALFTPIAIVSCLNLDIEAVTRYSIAYMPAHALLAADAIGILMATFRRHRVLLQSIIIFGGILFFARWTWPAMKVQRSSDPPPSAAIAWLRTHVDPLSPIYIHNGLGPQGEYLLHDRQKLWFESPKDISPLFGDSYIIDLGASPYGMNFTWPHKQLWDILRRRNFEISVRRVSTMIDYRDGWHMPEEGFRWMGAESHSVLPAFGGNGKLSMRMYVPLDVLQSPPAIEVVLNGATIDRFVANDSDIERTWTVPSRSDAPNELIIRTSEVANLAKAGRSNDARDLGLRMNELSWMPLH